jgi:hypothetical protein
MACSIAKRAALTQAALIHCNNCLLVSSLVTHSVMAGMTTSVHSVIAMSAHLIPAHMYYAMLLLIAAVPHVVPAAASLLISAVIPTIASLTIPPVVPAIIIITTAPLLLLTASITTAVASILSQSIISYSHAEYRKYYSDNTHFKFQVSHFSDLNEVSQQPSRFFRSKR